MAIGGVKIFISDPELLNPGLAKRQAKMNEKMKQNNRSSIIYKAVKQHK
jgi:hypothetical protein